VFQSLSGFLGLCNSTVGNSCCISSLFQSLSGFLGLCNFRSSAPATMTVPGFNPYRVFSGSATAELSYDFSRIAREFQSLSGFLGLCNDLRLEGVAFWLVCFNPYRVFSGSATLCGLGWDNVLLVSIPIGFSRALQLCVVSAGTTYYWFQSLSGFLGLCNSIYSNSHGRLLW